MPFASFSQIRLDTALIRRIARQALQEDSAKRDVTTMAFVPADTLAQGCIMAEEAGIIVGLKIAAAVFKELDKNVRITYLKKDGQRVKPGQAVLSLRGKARAILSGERTALNFLQHLSGVATSTAKFAAALRGTKTKVLDTRKTIPGMRLLEKYAVQQGGGENHRFDLSQMVLIKDNHLSLTAGPLPAELKAVRRKYPGMKIEIEADSLASAKRLARLDIDVLLLDNLSLPVLKQAVATVRRIAPRLLLEASGNMTLNKVRQVARARVDFISVGRLTHSSPALDISLQLKKN